MSKFEFKTPNKNHSLPYIKHGVFYIYKVENEKYPDMVEIAKGPKWGRAILNKKYLSLKFATLAIDVTTTEHKIDGGKKEAVKDLEKEGFDTDASLESHEDVF
jgi:hypothetical protein